MPLNDEFMLPKRVRTMAQMKDLLQTERLMIERLEALLEELNRQGSINNNTPLTKARLEEISSLFANNPCRVDEFSDKLTIHIVVSRKEGLYTSWKEIVDGVDVLIPAHLKYLIVFELPVTIRVGVMSAAWKIPYDLCGRGYAGELPWRNLVGATVPADISIAVEAAGHRISYGACGYTGEVPWRNMQGTQRLERESSVDVKSYPYQYDFCGTDFCGEEGV